MTEKNITAGVVMGSRSDEDKLEKCMDVFKQLQIPFEVNIMSAHRTPDKVAEYAKNAALLAARILALDDNSIKRGLEKIKKEFGDIQA